jgi:hypothetical protein
MIFPRSHAGWIGPYLPFSQHHKAVPIWEPRIPPIQEHPIMQKKSVKVTVVALVSVLMIAGAAFAYWTVAGSGTGQASTGTASAITVNQTSTVTAMAPGLPAQALSGNFDNPNQGPAYVASVSAAVSGTDKVGCDASDYTIAGTSSVPGSVAAGSGVGTWSGLTIAFNNKPSTNQNACKGATVTIAYTSN